MFLKAVYNHPTVKAERESVLFKRLEAYEIEPNTPERKNLIQQADKIKYSINDESSKKILDDLKITR